MTTEQLNVLRKAMRRMDERLRGEEGTFSLQSATCFCPCCTVHLTHYLPVNQTAWNMNYTVVGWRVTLTFIEITIQQTAEEKSARCQHLFVQYPVQIALHLCCTGFIQILR